MAQTSFFKKLQTFVLHQNLCFKLFHIDHLPNYLSSSQPPCSERSAETSKYPLSAFTNTIRFLFMIFLIAAAFQNGLGTE